MPGRLSDETGRFWPITIFGYIVQMAAVPIFLVVRRMRRGEFVIAGNPCGDLR